MLPLSVFWAPQWHPHEMLFGFALAVVAGNQLGPATGKRVALLFGLWLLARIVFLCFPAAPVAAASNAAFAAALALQVAPRLLRSAKKWRNLALPVVLIALCVAAAALRVRAAVLLLAMLMLFMGGRIIAPMVAGQLQRQGIRLGPRVQPRLEGALLAAMAIALAWTPFCIVAGALAAVRLARWRLWALRGRPDLWGLAIGYAWLAAGLVAFGALREIALMHLITVGAIGTLTFNVMAMSWLLKRRRDPSRSPLIVAGTALIALAALCRVLGFFAAAVWCWSAAFLLLLAIFLNATREPRAARAVPPR
jgi:uncharacterized protein involved in response to NO